MAGRKRISVETRERIHALRGTLKRTPRGQSFADRWAEHKREEKQLEERKSQLLAGLGKRN